MVFNSDYNMNLNNFDSLPIEKIHHKMLESMLGVNKQASNLPCRVECNREPLSLFVLSQIYKCYISIFMGYLSHHNIYNKSNIF